MKVSDVFPSEFLKAADLGGIAAGKRARVIIADVKAWDDPQGGRKLSIGFQNTKKRLLANVTNARTIAKAYGEEVEHWVGHPVILYVQMVDFRGSSVEAIRVIVEPQRHPAQNPQQFVSGAFNGSGSTTVSPQRIPQQSENPAPAEEFDAFGLPSDRPDMDDEIPF